MHRLYKLKKKTMKRNLLTIAFILTSFTMMNCTNDKGMENPAATNQGNAVIDHIMTRTSVRAFTGQALSKDTIELLLRAGMAAPSAMNMQPWHFTAITDRAVLDRLKEANPHAKMLEQAPLAIVVSGDMTKAIEGPGRDFWIQDCSAATENILLAAHALGLGAVWTGGHPIEERANALRSILNLPETMIPLCAIVIGYPAEKPEPKDKWKTENVTFL